MKENKLEKKLFIICIESICLFLLIIVGLKSYKDNLKEVSFDHSNNEYSYINVSSMSEKFAYDKDKDVGTHFVIEKEETGKWHIYIIAIKESTYSKYKNIIDASYERISIKPKPIKVYGYPSKTSTSLKSIALRNVSNFIPRENKVEINENNYETYLTDSYLDTTIDKKSPITINIIFIIILTILETIILIDTIVDKHYIRRLIKYAISRNNRKRIH